jgi:hypothetical protein
MATALLNPRHRKFCQLFVKFWQEQWALGVKNPRVGRLATLAAGYGGKSWSETNAVQTADVLYNRLVKKPEILNYLRELGLERDGRRWRKVESGQGGSAEAPGRP